MTGVEYMLLHFQDPILYIIRKQRRLSPKQGKLHCLYVTLLPTLGMVNWKLSAILKGCLF